MARFLRYNGDKNANMGECPVKQYVVDAFTKSVFGGNPAAVCVMDAYPDEAQMLNLARENNLSETAFAVPEGDGYHLRWFTPASEIDLCGHATLATGYVILNQYHPDWEEVTFQTLSGPLVVRRAWGRYEMEFPAYTLEQVEVTDEMEDALGVRPLEAWMGRDLVCLLEREDLVRELTPDQGKLTKLPGLLTHVTAAGKEFDCVSRSFAPKLAIAEDPVCGSGHCHLFPYWGEKTGKTELLACQASARGGILYGRLDGGKVYLGGDAALFSEATLFLPEK